MGSRGTLFRDPKVRLRYKELIWAVRIVHWGHFDSVWDRRLRRAS
jgi:hypothetical protein